MQLEPSVGAFGTFGRAWPAGDGEQEGLLHHDEIRARITKLCRNFFIDRKYKAVPSTRHTSPSRPKQTKSTTKNGECILITSLTTVTTYTYFRSSNVYDEQRFREYDN